ncbi:UDP-galactose transporter 1 isoform X2 [Selaginella moellendorffii]|uniref:UDP-galactose transporter 1 isoform X2 n=1 Tax=Selaginella moellendorffii TaxID=88036 RepID=UPI000D1C3410|nr:UDP-galactose transporter 1 isoform X2 [Selaginella moellendorffii]|eukprot:XP_024516719.1 UDP-galactose transporter 1 isoform X2 [Selaginella moellendorffii]
MYFLLLYETFSLYFSLASSLYHSLFKLTGRSGRSILPAFRSRFKCCSLGLSQGEMSKTAGSLQDKGGTRSSKMEGKRSLSMGVGAILLWWCFNVMTVVSNKWIFQILEFKFPLTVTIIHLVVSSVGAFINRAQRILPMSLVFCLNIVLGNVSLKYIPVSFMQTVKSLTPATTLILQWLVWGKVFDRKVWLSLLPVVGGILLASLTELSFNTIGFFAAFFGCLVTSTKTILAERLLHGFNFDSINTVYYMAPNAAAVLCLVAPFVEGGGVLRWIQEQESLGMPLLVLVGSGVVAFCLNFSIFYVIQSTTALTFNVAGNLKVAVAIAVSWFVFRNPISVMNGIGCTITLLGCTFYGYVSHKVSSSSTQQIQQPEEILPATKV